MRHAFSGPVGSVVGAAALAGAFLHPIFAAPAPAPAAFPGSISGYRISGVSWHADPHRFDRLAGVSFRLDRAARTVVASVGASVGRCDVQGTHADCSFASEPAIESATSLDVTATT